MIYPTDVMEISAKVNTMQNINASFLVRLLSLTSLQLCSQAR